jgi:amino acid permease
MPKEPNLYTNSLNKLPLKSSIGKFITWISITPCIVVIDIQRVSEFHRQTFRADSMIKNIHKTLNTYRVIHE